MAIRSSDSYLTGMRKKKGFSQSSLSRNLPDGEKGVSQQQISQLENRDNLDYLLRASIAEPLGEVLEIEPSELFVRYYRDHLDYYLVKFEEGVQELDSQGPSPGLWTWRQQLYGEDLNGGYFEKFEKLFRRIGEGVATFPGEPALRYEPGTPLSDLLDQYKTLFNRCQEGLEEDRKAKSEHEGD